MTSENDDFSGRAGSWRAVASMAIGPIPPPCPPSEFYSEEKIAAHAEDLRRALVCLATARRNALLLELADLEKLLGIDPTTSELRKANRGAQPAAVKIQECV